MVNVEEVLKQPEAQQSPIVQDFCRAVVDLTAAAREFLSASNATWTTRDTNFADAEKRESKLSLSEGSYLKVTEERMQGEELSHELYVTLNPSLEWGPDYDICLYTGKQPHSDFRQVSESYVEAWVPGSDDTRSRDDTRSLGVDVNPRGTLEGTRLMDHFAAILRASTALLLESRISGRKLDE